MKTSGLALKGSARLEDYPLAHSEGGAPLDAVEVFDYAEKVKKLEDTYYNENLRLQQKMRFLK